MKGGGATSAGTTDEDNKSFEMKKLRYPLDDYKRVATNQTSSRGSWQLHYWIWKKPCVDLVQNYENAECRRDGVGLKPEEDRSMEVCGQGHFL
jgi:hypothetical protein